MEKSLSRDRLSLNSSPVLFAGCLREEKMEEGVCVCVWGWVGEEGGGGAVETSD